MDKIHEPLSHTPKGFLFGIGHFIIRASIAWKILSKPKAHFFVVTLSDEALEAQFTHEEALVGIETHRLRMFNVRCACWAMSQDFDYDTELEIFASDMKNQLIEQSEGLPPLIRFNWPWKRNR